MEGTLNIDFVCKQTLHVNNFVKILCYNNSRTIGNWLANFAL